ncbi:Oxalate-binding protein [Neomoorella glycerini]|uniref:Oxalate-binding protein n=1 Tax=Neomoorella glycerini TaxID=55779 RepID=A0A6I5ZNV4_9FIRM|nr:cupin domain-containing protein [Moorella glycerini]QGP91456.1 Oxalate-binding protein [Moorella glycerini]
MLRRAQEMREEIVTGLRGGKGYVEIVHILEESKNEFNGKGRLFARFTLNPGASIGWHQHSGDSEAYYILSGQGIVNDNGTESIVKAGDMILTKNGEYHSIINNGEEDLVFIALILFA